MSTKVRAEISEKNKYWVEKHRYYELKHFCLQYPFWKRAYSEISTLATSSLGSVIFSRSNEPGDPTSELARKRLLYFNRMELIEQAAIDTDPELASYILKAVTEGFSFTYLKTRLEIPCSRDTYYDRYRRFFWLLDKTRD